MTRREIKSKLEKLSRDEKLIKVMIERRNELRASMYSLQGQVYDSERVSGGVHTDKKDMILDKLTLVDKQIDSYMDTLFEEQCIVSMWLNLLEDDIRQRVLHLRYFNGLKVIDIANELNYSDRQVYTIIDKSIKELSNKLSEEVH